ncbi:hypothetical protein MKW94_004252 [Papaver nudicaule]|uniref:Uncharacterized protein n=1 Tax=Papaver nudicaule TaxID=74823 RepID=A0AA41SEP2_PAPNU|nr:hypothetical protein [Papaver nudicaule]
MFRLVCISPRKPFESFDQQDDNHNTSDQQHDDNDDNQKTIESPDQQHDDSQKTLENTKKIKKKKASDMNNGVLKPLRTSKRIKIVL